MKLTKIFTLIFPFLLLPLAFGQSESVWVTGRISTAVSEERYDMLYYSFNFTVWDSNGTFQIGETLPTLLPSTLMPKPAEDTAYNFTGIINNIADDIPDGTFVVGWINTNTPSEFDWIVLVRMLVDAVSSVMHGIVTTIVQVIFIGTGYQVPEAIVTLVLAGFAFYFLLKFYKTLGLLFVLILAFLVLSGFANLVRLAFI
jgi:hypothetical protein